MNILKSVLGFGIAMGPLLGADVSGHWIFEGDVSGNPVNLECDFHQENAKVEGVCRTTAGEVKVAGEVSDPKVRFSYAVDYQGATYTLYYSGTLESDKVMRGEIQVSGTAGMFSGRKEAAPGIAPR